MMKIIDLRNRAEATFLELSKELYQFNKNKEYLDLEYASFAQFCADPDVDITTRTAYRLIGVYEKYILELELPPVALLEAGTTKLDMVRPYITEENKYGYLAMAQTLSKSDLIRELSDNHDDYEEPPHIIRYRALQAMLYTGAESHNISPIEIYLEDIVVTKQNNKIKIEGELASD
jgi:hypothetical protein